VSRPSVVKNRVSKKKWEGGGTPGHGPPRPFDIEHSLTAPTAFKIEQPPALDSVRMGRAQQILRAANMRKEKTKGHLRVVDAYEGQEWPKQESAPDPDEYTVWDSSQIMEDVDVSTLPDSEQDSFVELYRELLTTASQAVLKDGYLVEFLRILSFARSLTATEKRRIAGIMEDMPRESLVQIWEVLVEEAANNKRLDKLYGVHTKASENDE
jgi:hypothetical protein